MAISTMYTAMPGSPETALAADITADATTMTVVDGNALPAAPNIAVIGDESNAEVVIYNQKSGNTLSGLIRGSGGTTASTWTTGVPVARNYTSFDHDRFVDNIRDLEANKANTADLGTLAPLDTVDLASQVTGVLPIANGGTDANTRTGAVQALFTDTMLNSITHILTIKGDWSMAGYASLSAVRNKLGFEDSGWVDFNANSSVWKLGTGGYFRYRVIGPMTFVYAQLLQLVNPLTASSEDLITGTSNVLPSGARPVGNTNLWAGWPTLVGGESSTIQVTTGGVLKFFKPGTLSSWPANQNIACSGVYFNKTVLS